MEPCTFRTKEKQKRVGNYTFYLIWARANSWDELFPTQMKNCRGMHAHVCVHFPFLFGFSKTDSCIVSKYKQFSRSLVFVLIGDIYWLIKKLNKKTILKQKTFFFFLRWYSSLVMGQTWEIFSQSTEPRQSSIYHIEYSFCGPSGFCLQKW